MREEDMLDVSMQDMADIREELQRIKHENQELEAELRGKPSMQSGMQYRVVELTRKMSANSNVDQKARLLESRVTENADTIEQLRRERSLLVANHKQLQKKYTEVSSVRLSICIDELIVALTSNISERQQAS